MRSWLTLAALIASTNALALALVFCARLYAICREADSPFIAHLDVFVIAGTPLMVALFLLDLFKRQLPALAGGDLSAPTMLYRFYGDGGALLYVGITDGYDRRMRDHALRKPWWPEITRTEIWHYPTREAAARAEHAAITGENPRYNIARLSLESHLRSALAR